MPTEAHEALWAEASEQLRHRFGDRFERWLAPLKVLSAEGPSFRLGVASEFMRDWIESHYAAAITEVLGQASGGTMVLEFQVDPGLFMEVKREERRIFAPESPSAPPRPTRRHGAEPTLESYVVGVCNCLGYNAAMQVLECPGGHYNPLFVHGPTGVGKTHLLKGLEHVFRAGKKPGHASPKVKYLTSEDFTNQFVQSLQKGTLGKFRERFRSLDVLVLDDVQSLAHKKKTQEEFLYTFNTLVDSARQVILACDVAPNALSDLSRGMVTRFMSGLVVGLKRPDRRTRIGILELRAKRLSSQFDVKVLEFVADTIRGSARELIGALTHLDIHARLDGGSLSVDRTREILAEFLHEKRRQISAQKILRVVARHYGLPSEALVSKNRQRTTVFARHVAMYLMRRYTGKSLAQVGLLFGKRSHTTTKAAETRIESLLEANSHFVHELDDIVEALESSSSDRD